MQIRRAHLRRARFEWCALPEPSASAWRMRRRMATMQSRRNEASIAVSTSIVMVSTKLNDGDSASERTAAHTPPASRSASL